MLKTANKQPNTAVMACVTGLTGTSTRDMVQKPAIWDVQLTLSDRVPPMADFSSANRWSAKGNEVAHMDLVIGSKTGPAGAAFATR